MKKLFILLFLISPVYATEYDNYGIPYCDEYTGWICREKQTEYNVIWYQFKDHKMAFYEPKTRAELLQLSVEGNIEFEADEEYYTRRQK